MKRNLLDGERIFTIDDFLSAEECQSLIDRSEAIGYQTATVGGAVAIEIRNNARVIVDDPELASELYLRAAPLLPQVLEDCQLAGFNPRFRFYRYTRAESFRAHQDGIVKIGEDQLSKLTFMVYLCDVVKGGETRFYDSGQGMRFEIKPERGKALVFLHEEIHEGVAVDEGEKYVLRTDVTYQELPDGT